MKRIIALMAALIVTLGTTAGLPAIAQTDPVTDAGQPYDKVRDDLQDVLDPIEADDGLRVGVGEATMAFRAGAAPGQVGTDAGTSLDEGLYPYTVASEPGDGWHSEPTAKAFVVETPDGERIALVKTDLYLMQHSIHKRVADLVVDETGIDRSHLLLQGNHDHSHPYANSPSAGVCLFTDCFDLRQWSYMTRQIASAIQEATDDLQPATISAARTSYTEVQGNVIGPECATTMANDTGPLRAFAVEQRHEDLRNEQGECLAPAGFPFDHFDPAFATIRFDNADTGKAIGAIFSVGMHPESLDDGHGLTSADYPGVVETRIQEAVRGDAGTEDFLAGWFVGALGDVEPAEGHREATRDWWRGSFADMEDMATRVVDDALGLFGAAGSQGQAGADTTIMEASDDHPVDMVTVQLPTPQERPWGPDNSFFPEEAGLGVHLPSTRVGQETTSAWLTTVRLGEVVIAGFPGEPITDLSLNYKSRVDTTEDNVYQGYEWPNAPDWVHDRVQENFDEDEVADHGASEGFEIPLVFSMSNDWSGYYVTEWEYENRNHYRESMTPYGPEGAERVIGKFVEMTAELAGGDEAEVPVSPTRATDDAALDGQYAAMVAAEQSVRAYRAAIPPNQGDVGAAASSPADADPFEQTTFSWIGGSNAVDLPRVTVQHLEGGQWVDAYDSRSHEVLVRMQSAPVTQDPDQANPAREWTWTATLEVPWDAKAGTYRFHVTGEHRTAEANAAEGTFFDPLGADRPYEATSPTFQVGDQAPIPLGDVDTDGSTVDLTFQADTRDVADPQPGETVPATLVPASGGTAIEASVAANAVGVLQLDKSAYPAGNYTLKLDPGAWTDPAGNPTQAVTVEGLALG